MITESEVKTLVEGMPGIRPGSIAVALRTQYHSTYDVIDVLAPNVGEGGTAVLEPDDPNRPTLKTHRIRVGEDGEAIRHPVTAIELKLGKVTCSIDLVAGDGSPHLREPRTRAELEDLIRVQVGNVILESTRKPVSLAEHRHREAAKMAAAAERLRVERERTEANRRLELTQAERDHEDYVREHGEADYEVHLAAAIAEHGFDPASMIGAAVHAGAYTQEEADAELTRIADWKGRCEARRAARSEKEEADAELDDACDTELDET